MSRWSSLDILGKTALRVSFTICFGATRDVEIYPNEAAYGS